MGAASIEVLCVASGPLSLQVPVGPLCVASSFPARSDREPSIWQSHMDRLSGGLVHIFDCASPFPRRWAYQILDEVNWTTFGFEHSIADGVFDVLERLVKLSPAQELWFYSDAQWSNEPHVNSDGMPLQLLRQMSDHRTIRFNEAFRIVGG